MEVSVQIHIPALNIVGNITIPIPNYWDVQRVDVYVGSIAKKSSKPLRNGNRLDINRFAKLRTPSVKPAVTARPPLCASTDACSRSCIEGLKKYPPQAINEGTGGAFLLRGSDGQPAGVFKPIAVDQPNADNEPVRSGIESNGAPKREVAAYLLDRLDSRSSAGVPHTSLADLSHSAFGTAPRHGSLQEYVKNGQPAEDFGASKFSVAEVQRLAVLDMRLLNTDRHGGNILAVPREDGSHHLVPIDHGCVLPTNLEEIFFEWLHWPQVRQAIDPALCEAIQAIDVTEQERLLRSLEIPENAITLSSLATKWLQAGVKAGASLYDIARGMCRGGDLCSPSTLEQLIASHKTNMAALDSAFAAHFSKCSN